MPATREIKNPLTPRQLEFVLGVANGMTYDEIAASQHVSVGTVQNTLDAARRRSGARNLGQLVGLCVAAGFLSWEDD